MITMNTPPGLEPFVKPGVKFTVLNLRLETREFLVTRGWCLIGGAGPLALAATPPRKKRGYAVERLMEADVIVLKGHDQSEPVFPRYNPLEWEGRVQSVLDIGESHRVVDVHGDGGETLLRYLRARLLLHTLRPPGPVRLVSSLDPESLKRATLDREFHLRLLKVLGPPTRFEAAAVTAPALPPRKSLLTDKMKETLRARATKSAMPVIKIFSPDGGGTYFLCSLEEDGDTLWAVCDIGAGVVEYGPVSLEELERYRGRLRMPLERDKYFRTPTMPVRELLNLTSLTQAK